MKCAEVKALFTVLRPDPSRGHAFLVQMSISKQEGLEDSHKQAHCHGLDLPRVENFFCSPKSTNIAALTMGN